MTTQMFFDKVRILPRHLVFFVFCFVFELKTIMRVEKYFENVKIISSHKRFVFDKMEKSFGRVQFNGSDCGGYFNDKIRSYFENN